MGSQHACAFPPRAAIQQKVEVKGALMANDADILSAYSSEQGVLCCLHTCMQQSLACPPSMALFVARLMCMHVQEHATKGCMSKVCCCACAGFQEMTVEALHKQLGSVFVLDVRTAQEFSAGHVPGATNIPLDALSDAVRKGCLDAVREQTVAVICASGGRSSQATVRLSRVFGFPDAVNVTGGTNQWIGSGMPIEQGV